MGISINCTYHPFKILKILNFWNFTTKPTALTSCMKQKCSLFCFLNISFTLVTQYCEVGIEMAVRKSRKNWIRRKETAGLMIRVSQWSTMQIKYLFKRDEDRVLAKECEKD